MIKSKSNFGAIKAAIEKMLGDTVSVSVNLGRNKRAIYKGKISACYPALFTVSPQDKFNGKTSFSYSEIMCGQVVIKKDT